MNYDLHIKDDLKMVVSYLGTIVKTLQCKNGEHDYTNWNSHGESSSRLCWHCKAEMPESKRGEKNYVSQVEYAKIMVNRAKSDLESAEKFLQSGNAKE